MALNIVTNETKANFAIKAKYPTRKAADRILKDDKDSVFVDQVISCTPRQVRSWLNTAQVSIMDDAGKFYPVDSKNVGEQFDLVVAGETPTVAENASFGILKIEQYIQDPIAAGQAEDADCYGKPLNTIQDGVKIENGVIIGNLLKVADYTGFNSADKNEQNGYYLVFYANNEMVYFEQFYPYGATNGNNLRTVTTNPSFYRGLKIFSDAGTYPTIFAQNYLADYSSESGVFYGGRFLSIDKDKQWFGGVQSLQISTGTRYTELLTRRILDGENKQASMGVYINAAGDMYAQAPTYTGNYADNSSKIVTTAYMANHWVTSKPTTATTASKARPAVVVQNYLNGSSWYRVWSDGFIEQGGLVGASNPEDTTYTITFLKKFTNTNYGFWWSANLVEDSYTYYLRFDIGCYQNKTASNIKINVRRGYNNAIWRACGY